MVDMPYNPTKPNLYNKLIYICMKGDLALSILKWLICHKTNQPNKTKSRQGERSNFLSDPKCGAKFQPIQIESFLLLLHLNLLVYFVQFIFIFNKMCLKTVIIQSLIDLKIPKMWLQ